MHEILDAVELFFDRLASVHWWPVAIAVCLHLIKLACVGRSWRNIVAAAYPDSEVRYRDILGSYAAGVGVNAIVPARAGDVLKLYLAKHRVEGSTYTTLTMTLVVQTIFDLVIATTLFVWALSLGVLPSRDALPDLGAFDFSWFFRNPHLPEIVAGLLLIAVPAAIVWSARHIEAFRRRAAQGFSALRQPRYYFGHVVPWQAADWFLRLCTLFFLLRAFGIDATPENAFLAQVTHSLSTIFPFSPSGAGTEQALIVFVLDGEAPTSTLLAFSVGGKIIIALTNVAAGIIAIAVMLRTFRIHHAVSRARDDQAEASAAP